MIGKQKFTIAADIKQILRYDKLFLINKLFEMFIIFSKKSKYEGNFFERKLEKFF